MIASLLPLLLLPASDRTGGVPPDIVLIVADDLAARDLADVQTPNIDRLLERGGTRFNRAFANPVCQPTRRTLMFGRFWGANNGPACGPPDSDAPPLASVSLPDVMGLAGYSSGLFGKWHVGGNDVAAWELTPQLHGFDNWRAGVPENIGRCGGQNYFEWMRVDDGVANLTTQYNTSAIRDAFIDWWVSTEGPRFALVSFQTPHLPFHIPPAELLPPNWPIPMTPRGRYHTMIVSLDIAIAGMMEHIDDDAWVIFVGDNGTPASLEPRAKTTTFERGIHVPLIVSRGGLPRRESDALVHTVDFMATLADLAGVRLPAQLRLDSRSFARNIASPGAAARDWVFCQTSVHDDSCLRTATHKLRVFSGGQEELYDLVADPHELAPLDLSLRENAVLRDELRTTFDYLLAQQP